MTDANITHLLKTETWNLAASNATHGEGYAQTAWDNAKREAVALLPDVDLDAARAHFKRYGAWSWDELADDETVRGLLLQEITLELRETGIEDMDPDTLFDDPEWWQNYERDCMDGAVSGRIYRGDDDQLYFYYGD